MKTGRWLVAGIVGGIVYLFFFGLFGGILADKYYDQTPETWRLFSSGWRVKMLVLSLLYGLMVATAYATYAQRMKGPLAQRAVILGLVVWLVSVPQYLMEYVTINVPFPAAFLWIVGGLGGNVGACLAIAYLFGRAPEPAPAQT